MLQWQIILKSHCLKTTLFVALAKSTTTRITFQDNSPPCFGSKFQAVWILCHLCINMWFHEQRGRGKAVWRAEHHQWMLPHHFGHMSTLHFPKEVIQSHLTSKEQRSIIHHVSRSRGESDIGEEKWCLLQCDMVIEYHQKFKQQT